MPQFKPRFPRNPRLSVPLISLWLLAGVLRAAHPDADDISFPGERPVPLANRAFEDGMTADVPAGWQAYKSAGPSRSRTVVDTPAGQALVLIDDDTTEEIGVKQTLPADPAAFYKLTAFTRTVPGRAADGVYLQLRFLPSNKLAQVALQPEHADRPTLTSAYLVSPEDTTQAVIYIYTGRSTQTAIAVDEVRLVTANVQTFDTVAEPHRRITQTPLAQDGQPSCIIVTPGDAAWRQLGARLAATLAERTGARPRCLTDSETSDADIAQQTAVVIGNVCNNRALLYPYSHGLVFADELYPGDGGYDLRTVHDPRGDGHNLIVLGASDAAGAARGLALLEDRIPAAQTVSLPPLLDVELTGTARERWHSAFTKTLDKGWLDQQKKQAEDRLKAGIHGGLFSIADNMGQLYALTRRTPYADIFVWLIRRAAEHHDTSPSTYGGPWGMDSDFRIHTVIPAWDAVEECPALDDATRLEVARILHRWVGDLAHKGSPPGNRVRFNHITFPALGCLYAGQYFQKHYGTLQAQLWIHQADQVFRFQAQTTKPHCDCNSYQWLPIHHTMLYSLARGDLIYFENGCARACTDYVILNMNGLGYQAPYGDVGNWRCWGPDTSVLQIAHWYYRDHDTAWKLQRKKVTNTRLSLAGYNTRPAQAAQPNEPPHMTVWPTTEPWYNTFRTEDAPPGTRTFDKIAFRTGFQPDDTYLLLDGLARGGHGHMDANAILQWTRNDRVWLADTDYIKSLPKFHNALIILKNGQSDTIPGFCELRNAADLPSFAITRSALRDYAGADWERIVVWRKDEWFAVIDRLTPLEEADYSFRAIWQTLGRVTLSGAALDIEQAGEHARFAMLPGTRCLLHDDVAQGGNWSGYPHADPVVRVMQGIVGGALRAGETQTLVTVLHASGTSPSSVRIERLGPEIFRVLDADGPTLIALPAENGRIRIPDLVDADADILVIDPNRAAAAGLRNLAYPDLGTAFRAAVDLEVDLQNGSVACTTPAGTQAEQARRMSSLTLKVSAAPAEVRDAIMQFPAVSTAAPDASGKPPVPALPVRWTFEDVPDAFLVTDNGKVFGGVDAGMTIRCTPDPLEANVFSGVRGANRLANVVDGQIQGTEAATMWDDDQVVTIDLAFERPIHLRRAALDTWFATGSSKGRRYQIGHIRVLASNDGFERDTRTVFERADSEMHPSWGTPITHRADSLDAEAQYVRFVLTPRTGTAVYVVELKLWADADWLAERFRRSPHSANPFPAVHAKDLDGDAQTDILLGAASGDLIRLDNNGAERWRVRTGGRIRAVGSIASGESRERRIVAGGDEAKVYALSQDGDRLWTFDMPRYKRKGIVRVVMAADLDNTGREAVVVGADNWRYYALDPDGQEIWHYETVHPSTAGLAADLDADGRDELVLGTAYYWWTCVNPDGSQRWRHRTRGGPGANVIATGNVTGDAAPEVFFGGEDTLVQAVTAGGRQLWTFSTGDEVTALHCIDTDGDGGDEILVGSLSFNLYCLDGDGNMLWQRDLGAPVAAAQPVTYRGEPAFAAGCGDGRVALVRPADGTVLAGYQAAAPVLELASAPGILLVSTDDGRLTALSLADDATE